MLEKLSHLAIRLTPWRPLLFLVLFGSLLAVCIALFQSVLLESSPMFMFGLVGILWSLTGFMLIASFQQMPEKPESCPRFFRRQLLRIKRFGYGVLALFFLLTTLGVLVTTFRLIRLYL